MIDSCFFFGVFFCFFCFRILFSWLFGFLYFRTHACLHDFYSLGNLGMELSADRKRLMTLRIRILNGQTWFYGYGTDTLRFGTNWGTLISHTHTHTHSFVSSLFFFLPLLSSYTTSTSSKMTLSSCNGATQQTTTNDSFYY
ncbi:hypothetical protein QBC44DRAFT_327360 [Cladorrhinum sp. PSN332]|nr:hypothetical protein QBC44DRAFT_327360 [Cladorrhinum sp. PSN332]